MKSNYANYFKDGYLYQWDKDRDIFMITKVDIEDEFCLDQKAMDLFLKFDNPKITVGNTLTVKSGKTKANIKLVNEVLSIPNMEFTNTYKVNIDKLKIAKNFISKNTNKLILTGININNNSILATDSYSAYRHKIENNCNITIIPYFIDILLKKEGEIEIKTNNNTIAFEDEQTTYIGRLLNGDYPNLDRAFPSEGKTAIVDKKQLEKALSLSNDKNDYVCLSKNNIKIEGLNEINIELDMDIDIEIWFVVEKLNNIIKQVNDNEISILYNSNTKPILINGEFLVLPVKKEV